MKDDVLSNESKIQRDQDLTHAENLNELMRINMHSVLELKNIKVLVFTWNLGSQPPMEPLKDFFNNYFSDKNVDIVVLGFQEVSMSLYSIMGNGFSEKGYLESDIHLSLHAPSEFMLIHSKHFGALSIFLFIRNTLSKDVVNVSSVCIPVGAMNMANKGAIAVSLITQKNSLCFLCSHFPAHTKYVEARNSAFETIVSKTSFKFDGKELEIKDHQFIFWFGDLNYRVDLEPNVFPKNPESFNYDTWMKYDQLYLQKEKRAVFTNYMEGEINFKPTYKLHPSFTTYENYNYQRTPSWTDRILYSFNIDDPCNLLFYDSVRHMPVSDHLPVVAMFEIPLSLINFEKYEDFYNECSKKATILLSHTVPKVSLSANDFDFGNLYIFRKNTVFLRLKNKGKVSFVGRFQNGNKNATQSWLRFPTQDIKMEKGSSCTIEIHAYIDEDVLSQIPYDSVVLEEILVFNIIGFSHHFVCFKARYVKRFFGSSLEDLFNNSIPSEEDNSLFHINSTQETSFLPLQLFRITDSLKSKFINEAGLFSEIKMTDNMYRAIEMINYNIGIETNLKICAAELSNILLLYFKCLPYKLISAHSINPSHANRIDILEMLIFPYNITISDMLKFFKDLLSHSKENKLTIELIVKIFSTVLIDDDIFNENYPGIWSHYSSSSILLKSLINETFRSI